MMRKGIIGRKAMRIMALVCTTMNNKMNKQKKKLKKFKEPVFWGGIGNLNWVFVVKG